MAGVSRVFTALLFGYYIAMGTSQLLLNKGASLKGKYNTTFVVFLLETVKYVVSWTMHQFNEGSKGGKAPAAPAPRTPFLGGGLRYAMPAFFYALQNNMNILAIPMLNPHIFQLFNNLKIVTSAVFSKILLGRRFRWQQWFGMFLLMVSCYVSKLHLCILATKQVVWSLGAEVLGLENLLTSLGLDDAGAAGGKDAATFLFGLLLTLASVTTSGVAGVSNEFVLKVGDDKLHFWQKNMLTYQWGVLFNFLGLLSEEVGGWTTGNLKLKTSMGTMDERIADVWGRWTSGLTGIVWLLVAINVALGITTSLVFRYFDAVAKSMGGPGILFCVTFMSWLIFGSEVGSGPLRGDMIMMSRCSFWILHPCLFRLSMCCLFIRRRRISLDPYLLVSTTADTMYKSGHSIPSRSIISS